MSRKEDGPIAPDLRRPEEPEGVVLFDPTAPRIQELPTMRRRPPPRRRSGLWIGVLVLFGLGGGGYWAYVTGRIPEGVIPEGILPPPGGTEPAFVEPSGESMGPRTLALLPLGRGTLQAAAGSSVGVEVRLRSSGNLPVVDSLVRFEVASGDGWLDADTSRTNGDGIARALLNLPTRVGSTVVVARAADSLEARVVVESRAGAPDRITMREGNGQEAEVNEMLPTRVSVVVHDAAGLPVAGAEVAFAVAAGGGIVAPSRPVRTDSLGVTSALWRLGVEVGEQRLSATLLGTDRRVLFAATARERPVPTDGNELPPELGPVTVTRRDFVIGGSHVCALRGAVAQCRGANDRGQRGGNGAGGFVALATGNFHTCALSGTGEAVCWGANDGGQLGDGSRADHSAPTPVRTQIRFGSLTAGAAHTCGLAGGGVPFCWGFNQNGQLGDNSRTDASFPKAVGGGVQFSTLVAGWYHTCGLTQNGNTFCWGLNSDGQLGDGSRLDRLFPTLVRGSIQSLAAGSHHTCGASGDQVLCWGDNRAGQLGDGTTEGHAQPAAVRGLSSVTQVVAGARHTCALLSDGSARCWGLNSAGQLGDGTATTRTTPVEVSGGVRFRSLYAGGALTCGIATDGDQYCWGFNQNGQLGDGSRENRSLPTLVQQ